ncbi:hypothetical protein TRFO_21630 [Tritrichomonas foetus]|uniref:VPS9 domain-containing protein n=1 Tax=Tritrichomonas foetus TaxID=1144522 RepID=A0A1J4KDZ0_9EUKA|nr:hypothetical protein TRFO_21630 [Tritrichomonas foetus]|eukprot:OHT09411.1 hypothetical protein TRFO_21630 [Tritrichomonas foetus]
MTDAEEFDPLGITTFPSRTRNVDIISTCSLPKKMKPSLSRNRRKTLVTETPIFTVREDSVDDFTTIENKLDILFKNETTVGSDSKLNQKNVRKPQKKKRKDSDTVPEFDFNQLLNYSSKMNADDWHCIKLGLEAQIKKEKGDLDDFLMEMCQHSSNINEISDTLISHKMYDTAVIRKKAIKAVVFEELAMKRCRKILNVARYNIQLIDNLINFMDNFAKGKKELPGVEIDVFLQKYIKVYDNLTNVDIKLYSLEKQLKHAYEEYDFVATFLSPKEKSGRIVARFMKNINEMTYSDLDVILTAISPTPQLFTTVRNLLFDISWQYKEYPYVKVSHIQFPRILDLTPRSLSPPYLADEFMDTPFTKLNSTNWPYKFTQDYFFALMCYRNPFSIANGFWDLIQNVANVLQIQAVQIGGEEEENVEIGFDNLFPILLTCIYAFGCPEILDTLEYCSKFIDFSVDSHQQFAMTHCAGLVEQVKATRTEDFRRRVKLKKMIPIFSS